LEMVVGDESGGSSAAASECIRAAGLEPHRAGESSAGAGSAASHDSLGSSTEAGPAQHDTGGRLGSSAEAGTGLGGVVLVGDGPDEGLVGEQGVVAGDEAMEQGDDLGPKPAGVLVVEDVDQLDGGVGSQDAEVEPGRGRRRRDGHEALVHAVEQLLGESGTASKQRQV
jgi:hypothetical protein